MTENANIHPALLRFCFNFNPDLLCFNADSLCFDVYYLHFDAGICLYVIHFDADSLCFDVDYADRYD